MEYNIKTLILHQTFIALTRGQKVVVETNLNSDKTHKNTVVTVILHNKAALDATNNLRKIALFKAIFGFRELLDICGVDNIENMGKHEDRYYVHYMLRSARYKDIILIIKINWGPSRKIFTVTHLFRAAAWGERECFDMFGINFIGNLDLRRLLTDYGFKGFPLKKTFPMIGFLEVNYDAEKKCLLYEPVSLHQENRIYNFVSAWNRLKKK